MLSFRLAGPNGLETDVGVEDRTYVNNRDVESTDGLPDKVSLT